MADQLELLDGDSHRALRMHADFVAPHPHFVTIVPSEIAIAAASCPLFFAKDSQTGEFYAAALFGFEPGELLVETIAKGVPAFRPLDLQRQGFLAAEEGIVINPRHPRFDDRATIALFEADGTPSNALKKVQSALGALVQGASASKAFVRELLRLRLIEAIDISLRFDDGNSLSLEGLYTVSRDRLGELADDEIVQLFRSGFLEPAMAMQISLGHVPLLARRRNDRLSGMH